jgi:hypothetical protein
MSSKFFSPIADVSDLTLDDLASAGKPVTLTDNQLDQITGGAASISAYLSGNGNADVNGYLGSGGPGSYSYAGINGTLYSYGSASLNLSASADTFS